MSGSDAGNDGSDDNSKGVGELPGNRHIFSDDPKTVSSPSLFSILSGRHSADKANDGSTDNSKVVGTPERKSVLPESSGPGVFSALSTVLGLATPMGLGAKIATGVGGHLLDRSGMLDGFNTSGLGTGGVTDDPGDDSVSGAQQRSQQYTPGASKESDTPSATAALVEPMTAAQRRKRALARSATTSTETLLGA